MAGDSLLSIQKQGGTLPVEGASSGFKFNDGAGSGGLFSGGFSGFGDMSTEEKLALGSALSENIKGLTGSRLAATDVATAPFVGEAEGNLSKLSDSKRPDSIAVLSGVLLARKRAKQRAEERELRNQLLRGQTDFLRALSSRTEKIK